MSTLGDRIRSAREARGWLQAKLAEEIHANSAAVISNWEQGVNKPNADKILALCNALNVTPEYLLGYSGITDDLTLKEQKMIEIYRLSDSYGRDTIDTAVNQVAQRCASSSKETPDASIVKQPIFLPKDHPDYQVMQEKAKGLNKIMKQAQKSSYDVVVFLWDVGYGNCICAFDILMMAYGKKVPSSYLYNDIEAFLMNRYHILPDWRQ